MNTIFDDIKLQYKIGGISNRLIYWNIALFLLSIPLFYQFKIGIFEYPNWLALSSDPMEVLVKPWTLISYAFLHGGFWHLVFNMMVLNFSSRLFLTYFTPKQYLGLYLLSAIFAGIVFVIGSYFFQASWLLVGASAAVIAILAAATTYNPLMEIRLLLIGHVKLWHITAVILLIDLLQVQLDNSGGHIAHLGGAFFGYIYIKLLQQGTDLSRAINFFIDKGVNLFGNKKKNSFRRVHVNPRKPQEKRETKIVTKDKVQQQIDEILDKISQSGYDSLTKEEKEFLFKVGK